MSYSIYRDRITVVRRSAILLSATATATLSLTTQPTDPAYLQVKVSGGTSNTGTVTLNGLDSAGGALAIVLTFGGTRAFEQTVKPYASVDALGIVTTGLADEVAVPTIEIKAVGSDGSPVGNQRSTIVTGYPAHIDHGTPGWNRFRNSTQETEKFWVGLPQTTSWTPREGDEFTDQYGKRYEVQGDPKWRGSTGDHHWEVEVCRREA